MTAVTRTPEGGRPGGEGPPEFARARRFTVALVSVFLGAVALWLTFQGRIIDPDAIFPALFLLALVVGRGRQFLLDWVPFLGLLLGYEALRGVADDINHRVHWTQVIDADTLIGLGLTPTERLQDLLYTYGEVNLLNAACSFVYLFHFLVPVVIGGVLWWHNRRRYWRFTIAILLTSFGGFVTYLAFPVAPPWMAAREGLLTTVEQVIPVTLSEMFDSRNAVQFIWNTFTSNPVAAFPSLHAAYPVLAALAIHHATTSRWRYVAFAYPPIVTFAIVYGGEHYVVDAVAGWVYAVGGWYAAAWVMRRAGRARPLL